MLELFNQGAETWGLPLERGRQFLRWATQLHEIGLSVSHSGYHRHGAYLLQNSDMRGFSRDDQELLAAIVLGHRRKLKRDRLAKVLPDHRVEGALRLAVFLRVGRRLHRSRKRRVLPPIQARFETDTLELQISESWLKGHPLTRVDLEDEG